MMRRDSGARGIFGVALLLGSLTACGRDASSPRRVPGPAAAVTADALANHDAYAAQRIDCAVCHPCGQKATHAASWMDRSSPAFHAVAAASGLAACQACHGANLDGAGGTTTVSCALCHGAGWATNCTMCHGGADNQTGAPPAAIWGQAGDPGRGGGVADPVRVGAHSSHLGAPHALAAPVACSSCHTVPADALAPGHLDGATATVTFSGIAARGAPSWTRTDATCATYCHGATLAGGAIARPVWTNTDGSQIACGSCHGVPPPPPHVQNPDCGRCHEGYSSASVDAALHINGVVDVSVTCTSCHGNSAQAATAAAPTYAAPPVDTLGATAGLRVGTHQSHVAGRAYSSGIACQDCHAGVGAYTVGHSNGVNDVAFTDGTSPSFNTGTFRPRSGTTPASCASTWCHAVKSRSGSSSGGSLQTPAWTGSITSCTGCHGTPPSTGEHSKHSGHHVACDACHPGYGSSWTGTSTVNKALHVNGVRDVGGSGTRITSWNPATRSCRPVCHGSETW